MGFLLIHLLCALWSAYLAIVKNRSPWSWFFVGLIASILGPILLFVMKSLPRDPADTEQNLDKFRRFILFKY